MQSVQSETFAQLPIINIFQRSEVRGQKSEKEDGVEITRFVFIFCNWAERLTIVEGDIVQNVQKLRFIE